MGEVPRVKAPKKKAKSKKKRSVGEMIVKAVSASNERSGVSLHTLKQVLPAEGYNVEKNYYRIILSIRTLETKGTLVRIRGVGASGSFKLNDQTETAKKPAKVAAPKAKQPEAKKSEAAKKPVAAKEATKSPKKAEAAKPKVAKPKTTKAKKPLPRRSKGTGADFQNLEDKGSFKSHSLISDTELYL